MCCCLQSAFLLFPLNSSSFTAAAFLWKIEIIFNISLLFLLLFHRFFHTAGIFDFFSLLVWCSIFINFPIFTAAFPPPRWIFIAFHLSSRRSWKWSREKKEMFKNCIVHTLYDDHKKCIWHKLMEKEKRWRRKAKRFRVKNVSDFSPCRRSRARKARSENSVSLIENFIILVVAWLRKSRDSSCLVGQRYYRWCFYGAQRAINSFFNHCQNIFLKFLLRRLFFVAWHRVFSKEGKMFFLLSLQSCRGSRICKLKWFSLVLKW